MNHQADWEEKAIKAAMHGDWNLATRLNKKILKVEPKNPTALNRLARSYWEKGNLVQAQKTYQRVLKHDPFNLIAAKNLKRLADQTKTSSKEASFRKVSGGTIFLEEPGRTRIVKLIKLASPEVLSGFDNGDEVLLVPKKHQICVTGLKSTHLGCIPDDLSHYLIRLINGGNQYQAFIKSVDRQNLEILIREIKRASKFRNQPSFS